MRALWLAMAGMVAAMSLVRAESPTLEDCGTLHTFRSLPYLKVATALQALPQEEAVAHLQQWAKTGRNEFPVIVLCRMLFQPRDGAAFRAPRLGNPKYYGKPLPDAWPLEPIELVNGIPFNIVIAYRLAGTKEAAIRYLDYCLAEMEWTSHRYHEPTEEQLQAAFKKLIKLPALKRSLSLKDLSILEEQTR